MNGGIRTLDITDFNLGLFIWVGVILVAEKTFRQVYKRDLALS